MIIDLNPEQQKVIDLAVGSGAYKDPGDVITQALEIIREQIERDDWMADSRLSIAAHIETGFAQAERGELIDADAAAQILMQRRVGHTRS